MNFSLQPALLNFSLLPSFKYHISYYSKRKKSHATLHCPALSSPFAISYLSNNNGCLLHMTYRLFEEKTLTGSHNDTVNRWSVFCLCGDETGRQWGEEFCLPSCRLWVVHRSCSCPVLCTWRGRAKFLKKRDDAVQTRKLNDIIDDGVGNYLHAYHFYFHFKN